MSNRTRNKNNDDLEVMEDIDTSNSNPELKSFIVQNVTPGYHFISDIPMTFNPYEVKNLTWEKSTLVDRSMGLRASLLKGILRQITPAEHENIIRKEVEREKHELFRAQQAQRLQQIDVDGKQVDAEVLNLNAADSGAAQQAAVNTSGYANDPLTYAMYFQQKNAESIANGRGPLDPADFGRQVVASGNNLLSPRNQMPTNAVSGDQRRGRATVMMPPTADGQGSSIGQFDMTNYNRDGYIPGGGDNLSFLQKESLPFAEEIDLANDGNTQDSGGGVRRK